MKKILNFIQNLQFLFRPNYWIMLGKYDPQWDAKLNALAKEHDFKSEAGSYTDMMCYVSLNGNHIWVGNFPYSFLVPVKIKSSFTVHDGEIIYFYEYQDSETQPRPSRLTIHKLKKKLIADLLKQGVTIKLQF
jgi:hypothetical protein